MVIVLVVFVVGGLIWVAWRPRREVPRSAAGEPGVPAQQYEGRTIPDERRLLGRIEVSGLTKAGCTTSAAGLAARHDRPRVGGGDQHHGHGAAGLPARPAPVGGWVGALVLVVYSAVLTAYGAAAIRRSDIS